jgi:sec-independent protein translocase protein TatB
MFNVGGGELIVILLVALIVLGPQRLPGAARQVGKVLGDLRRVSSGFQNELRHAFDEAEAAKTTPGGLPRAGHPDTPTVQAVDDAPSSPPHNPTADSDGSGERAAS